MNFLREKEYWKAVYKEGVGLWATAGITTYTLWTIVLILRGQVDIIYAWLILALLTMLLGLKRHIKDKEDRP